MTYMPLRPRIGITPDRNDLLAPETEYVIRCNYADAVLRAGGLPLILPFCENGLPFLNAIDGLIVTGGLFDIDPALYGQTALKSFATKSDRTRFEKTLIDGALEASIPVLGICNGMQLLAVCLGGQLVQDIPTQVPDALEHKPNLPPALPQHEIVLSSSSLCLPKVPKGCHLVNSVHHQAVLPSPLYREIAFAPDGVIEAIEALDHAFAVGVQWHPEYAASSIDDLILQGLVVAAENRAVTQRGISDV